MDRMGWALIMAKLFSIQITLEGNSLEDIEKQLLVLSRQWREKAGFSTTVSIGSDARDPVDPMMSGEPFNHEGLAQ